MMLPHVSFSACLHRLRVLIHYSTPACNVKEQITFQFEVTLRKILTERTPLALTRGKLLLAFGIVELQTMLHIDM